jgi:hypothetical protein
MASLTPARLEKAKDVLESYRFQLFKTKKFDPMAFELELRELWGTGYHEMKSIAPDLLRKPRFREVAAYYMQNINSHGITAEYQGDLAKLYGTNHLPGEEFNKKRDEYWAQVFSGRE